ncbi:antibiotic biosynthesis monooxygenase [Oryzomonas rubra]|uniref:Antibiotic biosynthesis monooxygenase n=2 Tax=Oryzomonas rubra TaxID=2509454 RepID=A0A5A9X9Q1_9BACT|nr:antibiotic biosynthesis monooxygenase [Oryzomonas rubra]
MAENGRQQVPQVGSDQINKNRAVNFNRRSFPFFCAWLLVLFLCGYTFAQEKIPVVRLARLKIDAAKLESYKAALKEEIETSVRVEPGVLSLYAVSEKDNPSHVTIFEIYADAEAYKAHLETPHFKKYKRSTKEMVTFLELMDATPILLGMNTK